MEEQRRTADTQAFLDRVQLADLQNKEAWKSLTTLVQVIPDKDIFPIRTCYAPRLKEETKSADMPTIGVNYLSADRPLWFTLADCAASKLLTGKAPRVVRATKFSAKPAQDGLRTVEIAGDGRLQRHPSP